MKLIVKLAAVGALTVLAWPVGLATGAALLVRALWRMRSKKGDWFDDPYALKNTSHGSARWGWLNQLRDSGLIADAQQTDFAGFPLASMRYQNVKGEWRNFVVHYPHAGHDFIVGPPRSGKFTAGLAPLLLNDDGRNAIVIDPKDGELAQKTAYYRGAIGDTVFIDPFEITHVRGERCGTFNLNPMDLVRESADPASVADVLAEAILPPNPAAKESYWDDSARSDIATMILHLATSIDRDDSTLLDLVDAFGGLSISDELLEEMLCNDAADGRVQRMAMAVMKMDQSANPRISIAKTIDRALRFLENEAVRRTLGETDFDPMELREGRMTVYVILPNKQKAALGGWLRLVYRTLMLMVGDARGRGLHVVIDEFAALGRFDQVADDDMPTLAGFGVSYHIAVQSLAQLKAIYADGWEKIWGACAVRRVLGANDNFTADYVSHLLGTTTVTQTQESTSTSKDGTQTTSSQQHSARALMTPGEVAAMDADRFLLFVQGCVPFHLWKPHYYGTAPWAGRYSDLYTGRIGSDFAG